MRNPFDKPVPRISSQFGWRVHPILNYRKHHNGVDYAAAIGTKLFAVHNGKVTYAGPSTLKFKNGEPAGGGFIIRIKFKDGGKWYTATYMHLKKGGVKVTKGQRVVEGDFIGLSGNTGESTGPHLHFEIQKGRIYKWTGDGTRYLEPVSFIKDRLTKKVK